MENLAQAVSATAGGCLSCVTLYPIELVKNRMQAAAGAYTSQVTH